MEPKRKKVLFIAHWYPNSAAPHKGIFIRKHALCLNEIAALTVVDFSISYSTKFYQKNVSFQVDSEGLSTLHIHVGSRFYKWLYYFLFYQKRVLLKGLKKHGINLSYFDCVFTNVLFPSGILGYQLASSFHKKMIHIEHWSHLETFLSKDFHKNKGVRALNYASQIIVVSELLKNKLKKYNLTEKVRVIPNVVGPDFHFAAKELSTEQVHFLAIANWRKPKNPFLFIEALDRLATKYPQKELVLTMVGEGEQLAELKKCMFNYRIDYVGNVSNNELQAYFERTNYFLHASDFETFSIVCVESLLTGTPVIASRVGVIPEIVDESNGIICGNTIESWVIGIEKAMTISYDTSAIAKNIGVKYSQAAISAQFQSVLNEI